ncbi:hypothetical protein ALI22I_19010 [Saccharothrix sp. ALI-22-I]|nr:hypothetical protein ALI22I_19010 [Saccharothrix sp. ALI-22-I]
MSSTGAAIALPSGLGNDLAKAGQPRRRAAWVLPATLFLPALLASPFLLEFDFDEYWPLWLGGSVACALLWTFLAAKFTGAAKPQLGVARLLFWMLMFVVEPFLVLPVLGPLSAAGPWVLGIAYAALVGMVGWQVRRFYVRRRA